MSADLQVFEQHRAKLAASFATIAESMRTCANVADSFANSLMGSGYSSEAALAFQNMAKILSASIGDNTASDDATPAKGKKASAAPPDDDGAKKRKRVTKPKDPNAPKRPASSYIMFQNEVRKEIKAKYPDISNAELMTVIADQWKNMSDNDKQTYKDYMRDAKLQYSQEKAAYENRSPEEIEADNAAAAAALALKKSTPKTPRAPKTSTGAASTTVPARPPPTLAEVSPDSESSDENDDSEQEAEVQLEEDTETHSSDQDEEPQPKKARKSSVTPVTPVHKKSKKIKA